VYEEMVADLRHQGRPVPSYNTFTVVLRAKFKLILHKHKKFTECQVRSTIMCAGCCELCHGIQLCLTMCELMGCIGVLSIQGALGQVQA
jgi:hypothetical protein